MDPNLLNERVNSLFQLVDFLSSATIGLGSITVAILIAMVAMFFVTTTQLMSLNRNLSAFRISVETELTAVDTRLGKLDDKVQSLETSLGKLRSEVQGSGGSHHPA